MVVNGLRYTFTVYLVFTVGCIVQAQGFTEVQNNDSILNSSSSDRYDEYCVNLCDSILALKKFTSTDFELLKESLFHINYYNSSKAEKLYKRAINRLLKQDMDKEAGILMIWLADLCYESARNDSAEYHIYQAAELFQKLENDLEYARTANVRRVLATIKTKFTEAYSICFEALDIFEKYDDQIGKAITYRDIGSIKLQEKKYGESLKYCLEAKEILENHKNWYELTFTYQRIALIYTKLNQFEVAHDYIDQAAFACRQLKGFRVGQGLVKKFWTQGMIYEAARDFDNALSLFDSTKYYSEQVHYSMIDRWLLNSKGNIFLKQQKFDLALDQFNQALKFMESEDLVQNAYDHFNPIYENLIKANEGLGRYEEANRYMKILGSAKDSIFQLESEKQTAELQTKYQTFQKENEINQLKMEKASQRLILILSSLVLAALVILAFFLWRSNRYRSRINAILTNQKDEIKIKNDQNELLLKEIHHRVKNNLEIVSGLLELQSAQISDTEVQKAMLESQNRVQAMGILHQKLYQGVNLGAIEMKEYFLNLSEGVLDSFNAEQRVHVELAMQELDLDVDTAVPLGLIVNELLTNTLKYAFPQDRPGEVIISLYRFDKEYMMLKVADNGIGTDFDQPAKGTGFGGQLVDLLSQQLGGELSHQNNQGTLVTLKFKKPMAA